MTISPARQKNAVSEGMALGLVMHGCDELPDERADTKFRTDQAFEKAWRDWPDSYKSQFPRVGTNLRNGTDPIWVMSHADKDKQTIGFFWSRHGYALTIHRRRKDWDSGNPDDVNAAVDSIDGTVPLEGWKSLAADFLASVHR